MALSLLPALLGSDWWETYDYPTRITDQFFGDTLLESDLLPPSLYRGYLLRPRTRACVDASGKSEVLNDPKEFKVSLSVGQFKPDELEVKVVDDYVVVHGKHEEKSDEHGFISREFTRKYMLPKGCQSDKLSSSLTSDGATLVIQAPKIPPPEKLKQERKIPISQEAAKDK